MLVERMSLVERGRRLPSVNKVDGEEEGWEVPRDEVVDASRLTTELEVGTHKRATINDVQLI